MGSLSYLDWAIIIGWLIGITMIAIYFGRRVKTLDEYLLAGRKLRWWQVSLAQTADAVDASDYVSFGSLGYRTGMTGISIMLTYMIPGFLALTRFVIPGLRSGKLYTNAEYLEKRYTPGLRVLSMILQSIHRIIALTLMIYATGIMFQVVLDTSLDKAIYAAMIATIVFTFIGGQIGAVDGVEAEHKPVVIFQ